MNDREDWMKWYNLIVRCDVWMILYKTYVLSCSILINIQRYLQAWRASKSLVLQVALNVYVVHQPLPRIEIMEVCADEEKYSMKWDGYTYYDTNSRNGCDIVQ